MKYKNLNKVISKEKRKTINEKILYCIDNNLCEKFNLTQQAIFSSYTGNGGLHGLDFSDFNSFYDYTQAKQVEEVGQFYTGYNEAEYMCNCLGIKKDELVVDITAGIGNMFNFCPTEKNCHANEIDLKSYKVLNKLYPDAVATHGDMINYNPLMLFDVSIGNPPFNLKLFYKNEYQLSQYVYIQKCNELLKTGGLMALIVPYSFLNDEFSDKKYIEYMNNNFSFICQIELKKDAFKYLGVDNFKTKIMFFNKKSQYIDSKEYKNVFVIGSSEKIYNDHILPVRQQLEKNKSRIRLENMQNYNNNDKNFDDKIKKLLFDIKRNKHINNKYNECYNYYLQYYNQKKPSSLNNEEWEKVRITKKKVISKLKNILSRQHIKEVEKIKLVKTNYAIKLKGYSEKTRLYVEKLNKNTWSINDLLLDIDTINNNIVEKNCFDKLINSKKKSYSQQSKKFNDMTIDKKIDEYLRKKYLYDTENQEKIYLNDIQLDIVNKMLQKKYGYIQSSQGTGKTIMSIFYSLHRQAFNSSKLTLVIAPSIAIYGTWETTLQNYNINYKTLKTITDIKNIATEKFVLISFDMLIKLEKYLKKYLKKINNKYTLVIDEADNICNINSKRTKSALSVCRKAKYKLLCSGTMTRNNIAESFTQFQLLYNSSINFLSKNNTIYVEDKEQKILSNKKNPYYNKPFPQYKKGLELFKSSFNPAKITVFGLNKQDQNIYNEEALKDIIDKTIITKTFEDVVGKKIYSIHQHTVSFNASESKLYYKAIKEFYSMKYLFTSTGNPRKDRFMEIIQQITLLLNICRHPQDYNEYQSTELPNKYKKVLEMVKKWDNEYIAIGCRTLKEIEYYKGLLQKKFSHRKIYVITGSTTMNDRKNIVKELKETKNGILLSTQQSLSSSINIGYINKIICTALSWNWSTLSQWFFRFIRYTSTENKEVHFITYKNSLESNLLALLLAKENIVNFMKNDTTDSEELREKMGINFNLIEMLLQKEKDENGHSVIVNWGNQEIV